jgi:hypothetical protein
VLSTTVTFQCVVCVLLHPVLEYNCTCTSGTSGFSFLKLDIVSHREVYKVSIPGNGAVPVFQMPPLLWVLTRTWDNTVCYIVQSGVCHLHMTFTQSRRRFTYEC